MTNDRPVFVIDGLNAFIRSWAAFPQMTAHGQQMGGCIGFLKTLQRLCREYQPRLVYIAWEGGGSRRRRKIYPDYKCGRKAPKLNRFYGDDIPESEENRRYQLTTLLNALKNVPVCQMYAADCEGDDIIAHICRGRLREHDKVIVSSDRDLYQLLDDKTRIYSLHKKRFITQHDMFDEFRIKSCNFALAKSLCGDDSDNVPGIKGLGFKTVTKKFPMLANDEPVLLCDLLSFAASHREESAIYARVTESAADVSRNWQIVHLDGSMLSVDQATRIDHALDTFVPAVNKIRFVRTLVSEGINDFDSESFFYDMSCIDTRKAQ